MIEKLWYLTVLISDLFIYTEYKKKNSISLFNKIWLVAILVIIITDMIRGTSWN